MKRYAIALFAAAALITGCGSDDTTFFNGNVNPIVVAPNPPAPPAAIGFKQIEILARPGINEALLFTNAFLNAYNSVTPAQAAAVFADASPTNLIRNQALTVLTLTTGVNPGASSVANGLFPDPTSAVTALIPDVMRIDASLDTIPNSATVIGSSTPVYDAAFLNTSGSPIAGRKLTDDVIDFTYVGLLGTNQDLGTDHVNYLGTAGNPATGHQLLNGQVGVPTAPATFPYLAPAN